MPSRKRSPAQKPLPELENWYRNHGRHTLPWRRTGDAYAIWVSEVMLQQTQVETVRTRYYAPFLKRFPTISALAVADEQEVLKAWEGLGYYSRARNLHRAAKLAAPRLPETVEGLLALPGIGRNTAHAVAAFAYRLPVPVMEANVKRVLHRLYASPSLSEPELWEKAASLVNPLNPFDHNQAMMDLGAMVCTPKSPRCGECPVAPQCKGRTDPLAYPAPKIKKKVPVRRKIILVPQSRDGTFFLTARDSNFLGGLFSFPEFDAQEVMKKTLRWNATAFPLEALIPLGGVTHTYSHFRVEADVYLARGTAKGKDGEWFTRPQISRLPLSKVEQKILLLLDAVEG